MAPGVATAADRFVIEIAAVLLARLRTPAGLKASEIASLHRALASLGMTPADRSKVAPALGRDEKPAEADPWDALGPRQ